MSPVGTWLTALGFIVEPGSGTSGFGSQLPNKKSYSVVVLPDMNLYSVMALPNKESCSVVELPARNSCPVVLLAKNW